MTKSDPKHLPVVLQVMSMALLAWFASTASAGVDAAIEAAHRLPVVEQVVSDQGRRIERLERLDETIISISSDVAAIMAVLKVRR